MLPTFPLGPWTINTYGLLYAVMYLVIGLYVFQRTTRLPYSPILLGNIILVTILAVFLGSLLPVFFASLSRYLLTGFWLWQGQIRLLWGMAAGIGAAYVYIRKEKLPVGKVFDQGVVPFPLGMAIGRLGCFAAGCCYGVATDSWMGMYLRDVTGEWYTRYPTQLIAAAGNLTIFAILLYLERWNRLQVQAGKPSRLPNGSLLLIFVALYCTKRFFIQFLRYDYAPLLGPLDSTQILCLAGLSIAAVILPLKSAFTQRQRGEKEAF
jgi:phosphatidylglycerol:prolipoprotein diacylglycerol transferase